MGFRGRRGHRGQGQALPLFLLLLLLTGCGDDKPSTGAPPPAPHQAQAAPVDLAPAPAPAESPAESQPDPLMRGAKSASADPLLGDDPLQGRGMPTAHSHWLRGRLRDARVTVMLNGIQQGEYSGRIDQDITMKLRRGANTVTFVYQPTAPGAGADLELVESEHHPAIAPLVTFHKGGSGGAGEGVTDRVKPVTQTFPFVAE